MSKFQNGAKDLTIFQLGDPETGALPSDDDLIRFKRELEKTLDSESKILVMSAHFGIKVTRVQIPQYGEISVEVLGPAVSSAWDPGDLPF